MRVSSERIEHSQVVLNIELDPEEVERSLEKAYRRLVNSVSIPGFRKGKTPRPVLERHLGRVAFLEDAINHEVPEIYSQTIQEQGVDAIDQPQIEIMQIDPIIFKAIVPVRPTVELGVYRQIRLASEPVEITAAQIEAVIQQLRSMHAPWEPVERAARWGDLLTIEVEGSIGGKPYLNKKGLQYYLLPDSSIPVPGFAEQLEGLEKGQEKRFTNSFANDFKMTEFAGKEYLFKVLVMEIKEKHLPELNDEFAKGIGLESLDLLRQQVAADLRARAEQQARRQLEENVVQAVVGLSQIEFPTILVEREIDRLIAEQRDQLSASQVRLEDYLQHANKTEGELRSSLEPLATRRVMDSLVLSKVAELEKIEVSGEEIDTEVERLAQGEKGEELRKFLGSLAARSSLERALLTRKTVQHLVEIATGRDLREEEPVSTRKEAKDDA